MIRVHFFNFFIIKTSRALAPFGISMVKKLKNVL